MMKEINEDELRFVARHYRNGRLDTDKAWKQFQSLRGGEKLSGRRLWAVAASIALAVGIALACVVIGNNYHKGQSQPSETTVGTDVRPQLTDSLKVFRFHNEPIGVVLRELSAYYGRTFVTEDTTRRVTGEIQADSPETAVDILEQILGIKIEEE